MKLRIRANSYKRAEKLARMETKHPKREAHGYTVVRGKLKHGSKTGDEKKQYIFTLKLRKSR